MSCGRRAWRWLAVGAVAAHLGLTALYVTPDNPLRAEFAPVLTASIGRFFSQDWRLFAPSPADTNLTVLVSCLNGPLAAAAGSAPDAGLDASEPGGWVDLTTPLVRAHQRSRLSAYERLNRAQQTAARIAASLPGQLLPWRKACDHGDQASCEWVEAETERHQRAAREYLARTAASYCRAAAPGAAAVGLRLRRQGPVPWSQRGGTRAPPAPTDVDLGVFPVPGELLAASAWSAP